jgi:hypothetical protein
MNKRITASHANQITKPGSSSIRIARIIARSIIPPPLA